MLLLTTKASGHVNRCETLWRIYEILPWARGDAVKAAALCFEQWLSGRGGHEAAETAAGMEQVRSFLLKDGMSRFIPAWEENAPKGMPARDVAGFREQMGDGLDFYVTRVILRPFDRREALSLSAAAKLAGRSHSTLRNWCEEHGIGRRIAGGNWAVSRVALQMLLDGEAEALFEYHMGNRDHPLVAVYFERAGLKCLISPNRVLS
ncbi:hypothetical protein HU675_0002170 [Bradyrhizobium septentrionale]|nr:hypothetical protein [Bradyrhizobium septentrionale]UGY25681.1 hypothetical protein HU675_0002170 [Bradyrhizobium septentrionale]